MQSYRYRVAHCYSWYTAKSKISSVCLTSHYLIFCAEHNLVPMNIHERPFTWVDFPFQRLQCLLRVPPRLNFSLNDAMKYSLGISCFASNLAKISQVRVPRSGLATKGRTPKGRKATSKMESRDRVVSASRCRVLPSVVAEAAARWRGRFLRRGGPRGVRSRTVAMRCDTRGRWGSARAQRSFSTLRHFTFPWFNLNLNFHNATYGFLKYLQYFLNAL